MSEVFFSKSPCSILSNAFGKSSSTKAATCFQSIASKNKSVIKIFSVSVECCFLFPFWCLVRQFLRIMYSVSWLSAARSQILDRAGRSETGRLLLGISRGTQRENLLKVPEHCFYVISVIFVRFEVYLFGYAS